MTDFIEIDFIEAGDSGSGDAIAIRRRLNGLDYFHVVDGGYADDGMKLVSHLRRFYGVRDHIHHVVLTHPDGDHATGLETVLSHFQVGCLWMKRPWKHVVDLMPMFRRYQDCDRLVARLKRDFPKVADLEALAIERRIPVSDAFAGAQIGDFTVLSPSRDRYLQLVVESDRTPVPDVDWASFFGALASPAAWGEENLKGDTHGTSAENETSIVQFADVCGQKVLLTGDAGVRALTDARWCAHHMGMSLFPLDWFQVPHHGSRRNLSSDVLDAWLGQRLAGPLQSPTLHAIISANRKDPDHPKKAVVRALIHRGRRVFQTARTLGMGSAAAPVRQYWSAAPSLAYPTSQED